MKNSFFLLLPALLFLACQNQPPGAQVQKIDSPLHYQLSGKGDQTVVFIHGWCIDGTYWDNQVRFLQDKYQVLTLDLAGHGQSVTGKKQYSIPEHAGDVVNLINELELENLILVGHSMSGNIILHIYDKIPSRVVGMIGVDNLHQLGRVPTEEEKTQVAGFFTAMRQDFSNLAGEFALVNLFTGQTPDSIKTRVVRDFQSADPELAISTLESLQNEYIAEQTLAPKLKAPLYLILSDNGAQPLYNEESLKKYCGAGFRVWTIPGTGHYPMIEDVDGFNRVLSEILTTVN